MINLEVTSKKPLRPMDEILKEQDMFSERIAQEADYLAKTLNDDVSTQEAIQSARGVLQKDVDKFNALEKERVYTSLYGEENPMLAACMSGGVEHAIVQESRDRYVEGRFNVSIKSRNSRHNIDLHDFDNRWPGKGTLFNNGQWFAMAKWVHMAMIAKVRTSLQLTDEEQSDLNAKVEEAKENGTFYCRSMVNPSKANLVRDLQEVVDGILFIPAENSDKNLLKVTTKDVKYLDYRIATHGNGPRDTRTINLGQFITFIYDIMNHLTTGEPYTVNGEAVEMKTPSVKELQNQVKAAEAEKAAKIKAAKAAKAKAAKAAKAKAEKAAKEAAAHAAKIAKSEA